MSRPLEKRCSACEIVKSLDEFSRQLGGKFGRRSQCKACRKALDEAYAQANSEKVKAYRSAYRLSNYEQVRAREREREKRESSKPGYRERQAEWNKARREQNPEEYRRSLRAAQLRNYGLTEREYREMHQAQNGLCAICGNPQISGRELSIDHDHKTGIVRGLLCHKCNLGIGYFQENIAYLENAIAYLCSFQTDENIS
jgi:hypothetical protein